MSTWTIVIIVAAVILVLVIIALLITGKFRADEVEVGFPFSVKLKSTRTTKGASTNSRVVEIVDGSHGDGIDQTSKGEGDKRVRVGNKSKAKNIKQ